MKAKLKVFAQKMKSNLCALYYVGRDSRTPWFAKLLIGFVIAYAMSPIDLIPDVIPVLGLLDDLIIVPLGIFLVIKITPKQVWQDAYIQASNTPITLPKRYWAMALTVSVILLAVFAALLLNN